MYNGGAATTKQTMSKERVVYLNKIKSDKRIVYIARAAIIVIFFALWEIAANLGWIDPFIMSQPSRIVNTIATLYNSGELFMHIGISCAETMIGFVAGTLIGTLIASLLWWSERLTRIMEPYLVILNALPKVALGPIFIVWVGAGSGAIIIMTLAISLIVTIMEVLNGFVNTDKSKILLLRTFGASKMQIFRKVVLPYNVCTIVNSLKVNMGLSWVGVIMGEFLVSRAGIGYLIVYGSQVFQMDLVMTSVIILAVAAALMYQIVTIIEKVVNKGRNH